MSFLKSLILAASIVFAVIYFGSNYIVSKSFENWLGVPVKVGLVRWGLSHHRFILKNVRIRNPAGYSDKDLAHISRVQADYDATDLRHGVFKIKRLEVVVEEVQLERKSISECNILELNPLRIALNQELKNPKGKIFPILFQIDKVKFEAGKVLFETQLGNDAVAESRKMVAPSGEISGLGTPDRVALYIAFLALKGAGWQALFPTQIQVANQIDAQVNDLFEQAKQQMQLWQTQINQMINEKLGKKA